MFPLCMIVCKCHGNHLWHPAIPWLFSRLVYCNHQHFPKWWRHILYHSCILCLLISLDPNNSAQRIGDIVWSMFRVSVYANTRPVFYHYPVAHGSPARGLPDCITQPMATFANCIYSVKITQQLRRLGIPIVIFPHAAHKPAHNNGCGCLP